MEQIGLEAISQAAAKKVKFFSSKGQYFLYAVIAGCYCSLGMTFAYSAGTGFYQAFAGSALYKLIIGITFTLSFTMIIFAGSELFTGNMMVMTMGTLTKTIPAKKAVSLLVYCYLSNIVGAAFMGWMVVSSGLMDGAVGELLVDASAAKMSIPFGQAVFRGILCNILICLGTWMVAKLTSESAKMIALLWVVAGFVTSGYEHSIANAGLFTMALLTPVTTPAITVMGALRNLVPVTIGNVLGGAVFVGFAYWAAGRDKSRQ